MSKESTVLDLNEPLAHHFVRRPWWFLRRKNERYICLDCGFPTRHYDGVDRMAGRPVHADMTVAYRGYNAR